MADSLFQINHMDAEEETDLSQTWNITKLLSAFVSVASTVWASGWKTFLKRQERAFFFFARATISLPWKQKRILNPETASYLLVLSKRFNYYPIARPGHYRQHFHPSILFTYLFISKRRKTSNLSKPAKAPKPCYCMQYTANQQITVSAWKGVKEQTQ